MAQRALYLQAVGDVRLEVDVGGRAVAAAVGGVARLEAREALAAGVAAHAHAVGVDIGTRFAGEDLVVLAAVFQAEGRVQALEEAG